jgi:hypothetical protein
MPRAQCQGIRQLQGEEPIFRDELQLLMVILLFCRHDSATIYHLFQVLGPLGVPEVGFPNLSWCFEAFGNRFIHFLMFQVPFDDAICPLSPPIKL